MFNPFANITWRIGAIVAAALAALLFVGFATQTIRIEGFRVWPINVVGFKEKVHTLRVNLDTLKRVQDVAREKARAERLRIEAEYREEAERTDNEYEAKLADANARADAYARRMRVKDPRRSPSGPGTSPQGESPQGANGPGEDADYVAVSRPDYDILIENTLRLKAAHDWAIGLEKGQ